MDLRRLWKAIDRQKASYRRSMKPVFMRAFDKQIQPLYDRIMEVSDIRDLEIPPLDNRALEDAYRKLYMATAVPFAMQSRDRWKKSLPKDSDEIFEDFIKQQAIIYLRENAGDMVVAAGDTSIELIQRLLRRITPEILDSGMGGGAAQTLLRDSIQSAWHEMKYYRTERIVRTEVNRAANWASLEGSKSLGMDMNKIWISAFTKGSRKTHMAADGQKVSLEERFNVAGEMLLYPGDPAGSAENTINCLCSTYEELK